MRIHIPDNVKGISRPFQTVLIPHQFLPSRLFRFFFLTYKNVNYPNGVIPEMATKLAILGILLGLLIVNSYLTYRFLEIPAQRYLRKKFGKQAIPEAPLVAPVEDEE